MEDISAYRFDFAAEAERLIAELGDKADKFAFLLVQPEGAPPQVEVTFPVIRTGKNFDPGHLEDMKYFARFHFGEMPNASDCSLPGNGGASGAEADHGVVFINLRNFIGDSFPAASKDVSALDALYHETGHLLFPENEGARSALDTMSESRADAYSALRLLQRFGPDASGFLSVWSWMRAYGAMFGSTEHYTTPVLDKILADGVLRDFSRLGPEEMIWETELYSESWAPLRAKMGAVADVAGAAKKIIEDNRGDMEKILFLYASTCLSSAEPMVRYLGAKVAQPLLAQGGMEYRGETLELRLDRKGYLKEQIEKSFVRPVLGVPGVSGLAVRPPPGQRRIVFNPG